MDEPEFAPDYVSARSMFLEAVSGTAGRLEGLDLGLKGPSNETLTIDIAWYGDDNPRRVLIHSSGLHGVEGFAGSAIQSHFISNRPDIPKDCALAVVHALNPYGMAWLRRVNENNVDLNRNWLFGGEKHAGAEAGYQRLNSLLNPESPPSKDFFTLRAAWKVLTEGMPVLKQAVAGGQYDYPRGIFFGGKELQAGPCLYRDWIRRRLANTEHVCAIDVHTGLGPSGQDTLLVDNSQNDRLRAIYGDRVSALNPHQGVAYEARGGLHSFLPHILPGSRVDFLCQEFGTYSPLRVAHALREENRWHHYGAGDLDHPSKRALKEVFCPGKHSWRVNIIRRGEELLRLASTLTFTPRGARGQES